MSELGSGATLTFGAGTPVAKAVYASIKNMSWSGITRDALETTHLGTSGGKTFIPAANYDPGELGVTGDLDQDFDIIAEFTAALSTTTDANNVVVTLPDSTGGDDTWIADGFITAYDFDVTGDIMSYNATIKLTGNIAVTPVA